MNLDKLQEFLGVKIAADESAPGTGRPGNASDAAGRVDRPEMNGVVNGPDNIVQPSVLERMQEIQMAQKLGYLICKCTWPPQVMTLSTSDFIYRCPRCSRVRDF